jgi:hypothetical protein
LDRPFGLARGVIGVCGISSGVSIGVLSGVWMGVGLCLFGMLIGCD